MSRLLFRSCCVLGTPPRSTSGTVTIRCGDRSFTIPYPSGAIGATITFADGGPRIHYERRNV